MSFERAPGNPGQVWGIRYGESLVRTILKGFVGAGMLFSASVASAQDYTWTLTEFYFEKWGELSNPPWLDTEIGTTASGTMTVTKVGSDYVVSAYSFNTTVGDAGLSGIYDSSVLEDFSTDALDSNINMFDTTGTTSFVLSWPAGTLIAEMNANNQGAEIELDGGNSGEYQADGNIRLSGTGTQICFLDNNFQPTNDCYTATAGRLTLTNIVQPPPPPPVATPEPGTMAVLGAGLLGLFAARRRRAA